MDNSSFCDERQKAKVRDGCCQLCGATSKKEALTIHHTLFPASAYRFGKQKGKKGKSKKRLIPYGNIARRETAEFLILLCRFCHEWFHRYFCDKDIPFNAGEYSEFCRLCGREEFDNKIRLFDYKVPKSHKKIALCEICLNAVLNHNPKLQGGGWYQ